MQLKGWDLDLMVLGVAPPNFAGIRRTLPPDVWFSLESWWREDPTSREWRAYNLVGRLKPGYTAPQAQAEAETIFRRLDLRDEASGSPEWARVLSEARYQSESNAETGLLLLGIVGAILLLACANVACLLLARAEARTCEMAIRSALAGAGFRTARIEKITPTMEDVFVSLIEARDRADSPPTEVPR